VNQPATFDPLRLFRELNGAGVRSVVIGAFAGRLLGSPTLTRDLDVCHATDVNSSRALTISCARSAAGRPKDLIELEVLGALRDELDQA
jgi:hypothetical protein